VPDALDRWYGRRVAVQFPRNQLDFVAPCVVKGKVFLFQPISDLPLGPTFFIRNRLNHYWRVIDMDAR